MALKEKRKYPILKFITAGALALTLVGMGLLGYHRIKFEKEIEESNEPQQLVDAFVQALMTNDLQFAKRLVIPEQKEIVDQWKAATKHQAYNCPGNWDFNNLLEPLAWGVGGSDVTDNNTVAVDSSYGCSNNDYSIRMERVIVKYDGMNWKIASWDRICESSTKDNAHSTCYPQD